MLFLYFGSSSTLEILQFEDPSRHKDQSIDSCLYRCGWVEECFALVALFEVLLLWSICKQENYKPLVFSLYCFVQNCRVVHNMFCVSLWPQQIQIILLCSGPCSQHFCLSLCPTQGIVHKCGTMVGKSLDACGVVLDLSYYVCPWRESDCAHSSMSFHGCVNKLGLSAVASPLAPNQWKLQWFLLAKTLKQLASMLRLRKTKWYYSVSIQSI